MRSLAYALLEHEGDNPARRNAEPDLPCARMSSVPRPSGLTGRRENALPKQPLSCSNLREPLPRLTPVNMSWSS